MRIVRNFIRSAKIADLKDELVRNGADAHDVGEFEKRYPNLDIQIDDLDNVYRIVNFGIFRPNSSFSKDLKRATSISSAADSPVMNIIKNKDLYDFVYSLRMKDGTVKTYAKSDHESEPEVIDLNNLDNDAARSILQFWDDYTSPEHFLKDLFKGESFGEFGKPSEFKIGDKVYYGLSSSYFVDTYHIKQFNKRGFGDIVDIIPPGDEYHSGEYPIKYDYEPKRSIYYRYVVYFPKIDKYIVTTFDLIPADEFSAAMEKIKQKQSENKPLTSQIINKFLQMCKDSVSFSHEFYSESVAYDADFLFDEVKSYNLQSGQVLTSEQAETVANCIGNGWGESTGVPKSFARTAKKYGVELLSYEEI